MRPRARRKKIADPLVIVGQAPGRTGDPKKPLEGRCGDRLAALLGVDRETYLSATVRFNVFDRWPGKDGKGDAFPVIVGAHAARLLILKLSGRRVLLLGHGVARAFGVRSEYLRWVEEPFRAAVLPHPSGINRWWNDARNVRRAKRFLRGLISGTGVESPDARVKRQGEAR